MREDLHVTDQMRESQQQYETLVNSVGGILWEADARTFQVTFISKQAESLLGYAPAQWLSEPDFWVNHLHPEDRAWVVDHGRAAIAEQRQMQLEYRMIARDGRTVWLRDVVNVITEDAGAVKLRGTIIDISERKRAEEALRESEAKYRRIVETANEGVWTIDNEGTINFINRQAAEMLGYTVEEMIGRKAFDFLYESDQREARERFGQRKKGNAAQAEFRARRKDGSELRLLTSSTPIHNQAGEITGLLGMLIDISEIKNLEEQLRQSQKMEAIGQLAGGIAHDFNNMLTAINGYSELLLRHLKDDDPARYKVAEIRKAGERAATLTAQLLAFSRKQILQPKVLDLNEIVSDTDRMLQRMIGENIELITVLKPDLGSVEADPGQIAQVIVNLVVNACRRILERDECSLRDITNEITEREPQGTQAISPAIGVVIPRAASIIAVVTGCLVLAGWCFHIELFKSIVPGLVAMNPVTALAFILLGFSLWLSVPQPIGWRRYVAQACASVVFLIGLLKLSEYFFGWQTGVDRLLFHDALEIIVAGRPNRMAPNTALNLLLLGSAMLLIDLRTRRDFYPAQILVISTVLGSLLPVLCYIYGVKSFYGVGSFIPMALHTAITMLILGGGFLFARPDRGLASLITDEGVAGFTTRRLLTSAIIHPALARLVEIEGGTPRSV